MNMSLELKFHRLLILVLTVLPYLIDSEHAKAVITISAVTIWLFLPELICLEKNIKNKYSTLH